MNHIGNIPVWAQWKREKVKDLELDKSSLQPLKSSTADELCSLFACDFCVMRIAKGYFDNLKQYVSTQKHKEGVKAPQIGAFLYGTYYE